MLRDQDDLQSEPYDKFYIPLNFFQNFKPVNLEVQLKSADYDSKPALYLTICLEKQLESFVDSISTVTVHHIDMDPLPF